MWVPAAPAQQAAVDNSAHTSRVRGRGYCENNRQKCRRRIAQAHDWDEMHMIKTRAAVMRRTAPPDEETMPVKESEKVEKRSSEVDWNDKGSNCVKKYLKKTAIQGRALDGCGGLAGTGTRHAFSLVLLSFICHGCCTAPPAGS